MRCTHVGATPSKRAGSVGHACSFTHYIHVTLVWACVSVCTSVCCCRWRQGLTPHEREQSLQQIDHYVRWASWPAIPGSSAGRGTSEFSGYSGAIDGDFYIDSLSLLADLQPTLVSAPAPAPAPPNIPPGAVLRCPCGVTTARGPHTMKCDRCGVYQHQSCMVGQFGRAPSSWVCPECRLRSFVSYGQVVRALIPCTFLRGVSRTLFELPHSTYSQVVRDERCAAPACSTSRSTCSRSTPRAFARRPPCAASLLW